MKKIWILSLLWICLLFTGCFEKNLPLESECTLWETCEITQGTKQEYTWKYLALYPFGVDVEPQEPDYSRLTTQKLYNDPDILKDYKTNHWKDYYFLNAVFRKTILWTWENGWLIPIDSEEIVIHEQPTKEPIYFDWTLYQNVWNDEGKYEQYSLWHLQWNVLLTWYLETHKEPACFYCDEDEQKKAWAVEVWRIYPDDGNKYWWFVLWYTNWNNLVSEWPYLRYDQIDYFASSHWSFKPHFDLNLRDIANDWKLHTFHVILDDWWVSERFYDGSMIRERDFIE